MAVLGELDSRDDEDEKKEFRYHDGSRAIVCQPALNFQREKQGNSSRHGKKVMCWAALAPHEGLIDRWGGNHFLIRVRGPVTINFFNYSNLVP